MSVFQPTVGDLLDSNAERSPIKTALIDPGKHLSLGWSQWREQVVRVSNSLKL
jgi:acyl-CoA synthetase (AMP-forming)/AMP-acid ligase II